MHSFECSINPGNVIETHEHKGRIQEVVTDSPVFANTGNGKTTFAWRS